MTDDQEPSQERTRWAIVPSIATHDLRLGHAAFRTLAVISGYSDKDGWSWPKVGEIADQLRVTRQAVQQHISQLESLGYIEVERRTWEHGGPRSSRYRLLFDRWSHPRAALQGLQDGLAGIARPAEKDSKTSLQGPQDELAGATRVTSNTGTRPPEQDHRNKNGASARDAAPTRYGRFIDEVRRLGKEYATSSTDAGAVNSTNAEPEAIAEAYVSLLNGKWGDDYLRRQPLRNVIPAMGVWTNRRGKQYEGLGRAYHMDETPLTAEQKAELDRDITF